MRIDTSSGTAFTSSKNAAMTGAGTIDVPSTANAATLSGQISGSSALTKTGSGTLILTGNNNGFTGGTTINGGTLQISALANIGAASAANTMTFNGGTLQYTGVVTYTAGDNGWIFGSGGGTIDVNNLTITRQGKDLSGSGNLTVNSSGGTAGILAIGSNNAPNFTGSVVVNSGATLRFTSNDIQSAAGLTVNAGGTYLIEDNATANWGFVGGAVLTLNGTGASGTGVGGTAGAFGLIVQGTTTGPVSTFTDAIVLQTDSQFTPVNSGTINATLILSNTVSGPGNLIKTGSGILILKNGGNTYGGAQRNDDYRGRHACYRHCQRPADQHLAGFRQCHHERHL